MVRWISERLTVVSAVWLAVGLAFSAFVIWAFFELADEVLEGDSRAFDRAVLLWIQDTFPDWLDGPMRLVTALGYYYVVVPLLVMAVFVFYRRGWRLSAVLLAVSTGGSIVLTTVLKGVFQRARPELFDSGYQASFYSFPSGHATVAVGFYGMLTVILAYRLRGRARWAVAVSWVARRAPDRAFQALPRRALPDRHTRRLPLGPPVAGLRRGCLRAVALGQGLEGGRVWPRRRIVSSPDGEHPPSHRAVRNLLVFFGVMVESMGVPLPGETILIAPAS